MKTGFEDKRIELDSGYTLNFPGIDCIVDECIGKGSNAIVYLGHYADHQIKDLYHRILIKELYPFDGKENDGISRSSNGEITVPSSSEVFFAVHKKSYLSGNRFHLKLLADNPGELDSHINTFEYNNTLYSILEFTGGRSMLQEIQKGEDLSLERIMKWMNGLLTVLNVFHEAGYLHLDISLDNILLVGEGETERVTLIDYNSIISLEELKGPDDVILSVKKGNEYAATEILHAKREKIGPWTDLYSVTAVFFHLLFNRRRSLIERKNSFVLPDTSKSTALKGQNSIVLDMISTILKKGFESSPQSRYQTIKQMKTDFAELEERIACRGITHWALWQKGNDYVTDIIKNNTTWHFLMDPHKIYPLKAQPLTTEDDQNNEITLLDDSFRKEMVSKKPVLLLGSGGMGKTTFMLRLAYNRDKNYTSKSMAVIYISLFGWKNGDKTFIQDKILEKLDFSHEQLESARKELRHLLGNTIQTNRGAVPSVLLCLDGLNEASGDISPLLDEIQELNTLSGVKIVLTSRSEITGNEFNRWVISRLTHEDVQTILKQRHIPEPENMEIMELLHIPIMLSMYIEALNGRKFLKLDTKDELLEEYLSVLITKEARNSLNLDSLIPADTIAVQDSPAYFGAQVAVKYILPEIAALLQKQKSSLSEKELYHCVEKCYKYLNQKAFTGVFDKWIGHTSELKLGAKNADEWYGKVVQEILWKKLGLLVRDMDCYRISHQIIEEYMVQKSIEFHVQFDLERKKLKNRRRILSGAVVMAAILLFGLYNYYMSTILREQNQTALKNESAALAYASESKLKEGDRTAALTLALQALPTEDNDRPYVADAENALIDALYLSKDDGYQAMHKVNLSVGNWKNEISKDGTYFVALDENGYLRCYNTQTEELLWSYFSAVTSTTRSDRLSLLSIIESQNAVLFANENSETILLSLETGKEIWKFSYSELNEDRFGDIEQIALSGDQQILAIGYETRKSNTGYTYNYDVKALFKKITFIDMTTGKQLSKTNALPVSFSIYCSFTGNGVFSDGNTAYATLINDIHNSTYELITVDPFSGEVKQTAWVKQDSSIHTTLETLSTLYYLPPTIITKGGFLIYVYEYDSSSHRSGMCQIAYLEEGASDWSYNDSNIVPSNDTTLPDLVTYQDTKLFIYSDVILMTGINSGMILCTRQFNDNTIAYYFVSKGAITLILKDGRQRAFSLPSLNAYEYLSKRVSNFEVSGAVGYHNEKEPFVLIPEEDGNSIVLYEWWQNEEIGQIVLSEDELDGSNFFGRIFVFPNGKEFLYLDDEEKDDAKDSYIYENTGRVYNIEGELVDQFVFDAKVSFVTNQLQVSEDSRYLVSNDYIYDMTLHQLITLEDFFLEKQRYPEIKCAVTNSGIQAICLFENEMQVLENGKGDLETSEYIEKFNLAKLDRSYTEQHPDKSFENITLGKNDMVVLCCSDNSEDEGNRISKSATDYYLVYFIKEKKWVRVENKAETKDYPNLTIAKEKAIFAAFDDDKAIRIYDANTGEALYEYQTSINVEAIIDMQFILNDRYLVILTQENGCTYQIIRIEDGTIVGQYVSDNASKYANLVVHEDAENNRIYLFDNESWRTALEINTERWTEVNRIPYLKGIIGENMFIINDHSNLQLVPRNDLSTLIKKAEDILNSSTKNSSTKNSSTNNPGTDTPGADTPGTDTPGTDEISTE